MDHEQLFLMIRNVSCAVSWDARHEILFRIPSWQPGNALDTLLLEFRDLLQLALRGFDPKVSHTSLEGILGQLNSFLPDNVVARLHSHVSSNLLPYGILQRMIDTNLSMHTNNVLGLLHDYHWPVNSPAYHHMQQLLTRVLVAMQAFRTAPHLPDAMAVLIQTLLNIDADHRPHLSVPSREQPRHLRLAY